MFYRLLKTATSVAYLLLIWLTWQWFQGGLNWEFSAGCLLVSSFWLALTRLEMRSLFKTYFDVLSRLQVLLPVVLGVVLSSLSFFSANSMLLQALAGLSLLWWGYIYFLYRKNRKQYIKQGHGPLPKDCWLNPDPRALQPGDLILTSGRIATRLHESVGHGELALRLADGTMGCFSSYMEKGAIMNDLATFTAKVESRGHYVVMRLAKPLTEKQVALAADLADVMLEQNRQWRDSQRARRLALISRLPVPASFKAFLSKKFRVTGYDWLGLFLGRRASNRWTCIGACLELYWRLGIKMNTYGTGLLGLGTGILDPIMPVRFLSDPAFRILSEQDRLAFESRKQNA